MNKEGRIEKRQTVRGEMRRQSQIHVIETDILGLRKIVGSMKEGILLQVTFEGAEEDEK